MHFSTILVTCLAFGQLPSTSPPPSKPSVTQSPLGPIVPLELKASASDKAKPIAESVPPSEATSGQSPPKGQSPAKPALTPGQIVAEAIVLPGDHSLTGKRLTLLEAVSSTTNRRQQIKIVHAYWQLFEALGEYRFCWDYDRRLEDLSARTSGRVELRTAQAASAAQLGSAKAAVVAAQHDLASLAFFAPQRPLPLPASLPYIDTYRTDFDKFPSRRTAPSTLRLIDRILPIRQRAIHSRARAVAAAEDALDAAMKAYRQNQTDLQTVLTCTRQCRRQRRALIRTVSLYNRDIADYAMTVAPPSAAAGNLVAMLIRSAQGPVQVDRSGAKQVRFDQPIPEEATARDSAPRQAVTPPSTPSKTDGRWMPGGGAPVAPFPPEPSAKDAIEKHEPDTEGGAKQGAKEGFGTADSELPKRPIVPIEPAAVVREAKKEPIDGPALVPPQTPLPQPKAAPRQLQPVSPAAYPALVALAPPKQTKELAETLYWNHSLPKGKPVSLEESLGGVSSRNRKALILTYWQARQRAAEYQVVLAQANSVDELIRSTRGGGEFPLRRLRSAQATTQAAKEEAHVALVESQHALAYWLRRSSDELWPIPSTAPHSGPYSVNLEALPPKLAESWSLRRSAAMIPAMGQSVRQYATAVVEADAARADAAAKFAADPRTIEQMVATINRQTDLTFGFLQSLTDYNLAIADYALAVLPPETPSKTLVGTLMTR